MKNAFKISTLLLVLLTISFGLHAQSNSTKTAGGIIYSAGLETGISSGNFNTAYRWNIGGSLQADIPVASQFYINVNAGYLNFTGKDNIHGTGVSAPNIRLLPATAGLKYFPISIFYVQADAGAAFILNKNDLGYSKTAAFLYSPGIGARIPIGGSSSIDAGIKYEGTGKYVTDVEDSKINFFELRVAYAFSLK